MQHGRVRIALRRSDGEILNTSLPHALSIRCTRRPVFGRSVLLFDRADRDQLAALGEVRRPSIADLFVADNESRLRDKAQAQGSA